MIKTKEIAARIYSLDPHGFQNAGANGYADLEGELIDNPLSAIEWLLDYINNMEDRDPIF